MEDGHRPIPDKAGEECVHHWLIDEKNFGVCKKCGANKQFQSSSWYDSSIKKNAYNRSAKAPQHTPGTEG